MSGILKVHFIDLQHKAHTLYIYSTTNKITKYNAGQSGLEGHEI